MLCAAAGPAAARTSVSDVTRAFHCRRRRDARHRMLARIGSGRVPGCGRLQPLPPVAVRTRPARSDLSSCMSRPILAHAVTRWEPVRRFADGSGRTVGMKRIGRASRFRQRERNWKLTLSDRLKRPHSRDSAIAPSIDRLELSSPLPPGRQRPEPLKTHPGGRNYDREPGPRKEVFEHVNVVVIVLDVETLHATLVANIALYLVGVALRLQLGVT